jgi:hypothetical protein
LLLLFPFWLIGTCRDLVPFTIGSHLVGAAIFPRGIPSIFLRLVLGIFRSVRSFVSTCCGTFRRWPVVAICPLLFVLARVIATTFLAFSIRMGILIPCALLPNVNHQAVAGIILSTPGVIRSQYGFYFAQNEVRTTKVAEFVQVLIQSGDSLSCRGCYID